MPRFLDFDARGYRSVDVRTGYGDWVATYEQTVQDTMDVALLERLSSVEWGRVQAAVDLGCGTGRTGLWLRQRGVGMIDGVDLTPEMLSVARNKGVYRSLVEADLGATRLPGAAYDLVSVCLVDEHLADLQPLYREAFRLARPAGCLVLVGYHPQFIMAAGMPTHYTSRSGEQVAIDTHLHLLSEHVTAALSCGWRLSEMRERVIDESYLAHKPKWERFRNQPIAFAFAWHKS
jgi:SAM-dependent methyltransferase